MLFCFPGKPLFQMSDLTDKRYDTMRYIFQLCYRVIQHSQQDYRKNQVPRNNYSCTHETQKVYLLLSIPNLRGYRPIACSGKPNPHKRQSHLSALALRTRGGVHTCIGLPTCTCTLRIHFRGTYMYTEIVLFSRVYFMGTRGYFWLTC